MTQYSRHLIWQNAHQFHLAVVLIMVIRKGLETQCRCIVRMTDITPCAWDHRPWACLLWWLRQSFCVLGIWFIMHWMQVLATKQCSSQTLVNLVSLDNATIGEIQHLYYGDECWYICRSITATFRKYITCWSCNLICMNIHMTKIDNLL